MPYPHSGLGEVGPDGDLLAGAHVRVAVPLEGGLQLLQLLAGEVRPLPPLLLLLGVVRVAIIAPVFNDPLFLYQVMIHKGTHMTTHIVPGLFTCLGLTTKTHDRGQVAFRGG